MSRCRGRRETGIAPFPTVHGGPESQGTRGRFEERHAWSVGFDSGTSSKDCDGFLTLFVDPARPQVPCRHDLGGGCQVISPTN